MKKKFHITRTSKELAKALHLDQSVILDWEVRFHVEKQIIRNFEAKDLRMTEIAEKAETS